jgi:hypothetical protein
MAWEGTGSAAAELVGRSERRENLGGDQGVGEASAAGELVERSESATSILRKEVFGTFTAQRPSSPVLKGPDWPSRKLDLALSRPWLLSMAALSVSMAALSAHGARRSRFASRRALPASSPCSPPPLAQPRADGLVCSRSGV